MIREEARQIHGRKGDLLKGEGVEKREGRRKRAQTEKGEKMPFKRKHLVSRSK